MRCNEQEIFQPKKTIVTRAFSQATQLLDKLSALGIDPIPLPTIEIQAPSDGGKELRESIQNLEDYDWVILTSANGVEMFLQEVSDISVLERTQIAAIGLGTKQALKEYGLETDLIPNDYVAEGLLEVFPDFQEEGRILLPRGAKGRDVLPETLREAGWIVDVIPTYQTCIPEKFDPFDNQTIGADSIIFTSASTVENFVKMYGLENMPPNLISIGPITTKSIHSLDLHVALEADPHTIQGIIDCLQVQFEKMR